MLIEGLAEGIEPIEVRRKVDTNMRFDLVTHEHDGLFSIFAKELRDRDEIEANDALPRQTVKRRDAKWVAVTGTKSQGSTASGHDSRDSPMAAGLQTERNPTYGNT